LVRSHARSQKDEEGKARAERRAEEEEDPVELFQFPTGIVTIESGVVTKKGCAELAAAAAHEAEKGTVALLASKALTAMLVKQIEVSARLARFCVHLR
jgi:hypothetical protein